MKLTEQQQKILSELAPRVKTLVQSGMDMEIAIHTAFKESIDFYQEMIDQKTKRSKAALKGMMESVYTKIRKKQYIVDRIDHISSALKEGSITISEYNSMYYSLRKSLENLEN